MACPRCQGTLAKWGYGRTRTVRSLGTEVMTFRPRRARCRDCQSTHILLPTALQARQADTTEVIGTALMHKAEGLGFRRIAARMGRAESTVRRWLRRTDDTHLDWMYRQAISRLAALAPDVVGEIRYAGNPLKHTLTVLAATAYWDRHHCGFTDPPWALIGIYTQGRLLSPGTG